MKRVMLYLLGLLHVLGLGAVCYWLLDEQSLRYVLVSALASVWSAALMVLGIYLNDRKRRGEPPVDAQWVQPAWSPPPPPPDLDDLGEVIDDEAADMGPQGTSFRL